jgi:hypothetical protein
VRWFAISLLRALLLCKLLTTRDISTVGRGVDLTLRYSRLFTSLTFVYAVIQHFLKEKSTRYVRLQEDCVDDPDGVISGPYDEKALLG